MHPIPPFRRLAGLALAVVAALALAACSTPDDALAPTPRASLGTFAFQVDPATGAVTEVAGLAAADVGPVALDLVTADTSFLPGNVLRIEAVFENASPDTVVTDLAFAPVPPSGGYDSSAEPAVTPTDFGPDGVLSPGERTSVLAFLVHHNGTTFTYVVEATGATEPVEREPGTITGRVIDAVSTDPIAGATVSANGVAATTGEDGTFAIEVAPGTYDVEASADGCSNATAPAVAVGEGATADVGDLPLSCAAAEGDLRIVLTWGSTPRDLDSHLTGPDGSGGRIHVWYRDPTEPGANLDVDDVSSFGPETITVTAFESGTYRYSVHDFSTYRGASSTALRDSGARVRVFRGATEIAVFDPPDDDGTVWAVFEYDGDTSAITPIGTIDNLPAGGEGDIPITAAPKSLDR